MSKPAQPVDVDDEDMYEVERILEKRIDKKGAVMYLVKWEGFSEQQATWEPADHLDGLQWLVDEFNGKKKRKAAGDAEPPKKHHEKTASPKLEPKQETKQEAKLETKDENSDAEPAVSVPPEQLVEESRKHWRGPPRIKGAKKDPKPHAKSPVSSTAVLGIRATRGSLTLDVAVKILGCRRQGKVIEYAVQFKRRSDGGVVVLPQICTHEELRMQAPWLLSQYLLESAKVED